MSKTSLSYMVGKTGACQKMRRISLFALLAMAASVSACEFAQQAVVPSVTGQPPATLSPAPIVPLDVAKFGTPSSTPTGTRIGQLRSDLLQLQQAAVEQVQRGRQLQADTEANVAGYQITVGASQNGQQGAGQQGAGKVDVATWQRGQGQLQAISANLDQMNALASAVAKNIAYAAFLQQSIQGVSASADASAEDRRQLLVLSESTRQTSNSLDQLLDGLRQEILHQSHFLGTEGAKLAQLAPPGVSAPTAAAPQASIAPGQPGSPGAGLASGRPFVVIRFDNPGVEYEQQLYDAVSAALARSPNVAFDLVAVVPATGTSEEIARNAEAARASAEKVMQSLLNMGLPADRVSVSQVTDPNIQSNEVRLYVR